MNISLGIILGLIAMFGFGIGNAIIQVPARAVENRKVIFFRTLFSTLMIFITLIFFLPETTFSLTYILIAFVISFIGYIPLFTFYKALKSGKVGIITTISSSSVIFTVLFSIIFFKESLTLPQVFSIVLIILGIMLISIDFKDFKNSSLFSLSSGVPFALITCLLWGIMYFLMKIPVSVLGPILTSLIIESGIMILSGINLAISKTGFKIHKRKILFYIFLSSLFVSIGSIFFNLGIKLFDVSIVAALTFSSPLISTLYGKFVYKERLRTSQYLAISLMIIGIIVISYF